MGFPSLSLPYIIPFLYHYNRSTRHEHIMP